MDFRAFEHGFVLIRRVINVLRFREFDSLSLAVVRCLGRRQTAFTWTVRHCLVLKLPHPIGNITSKPVAVRPET